jgi:superfamily II RNA helicase
MINNNLSSYLTIFTNKICNDIIPDEDLAYKFPYELDAFQKRGIYNIYKNENVLITAHTGSGKTVLAIYCIAHNLKKNKKVIYTSPIKSLSNQKYAEFIKIFGNDSSIGIMTGDIKMNPDGQCIIMTTEILRNILYKKSTSENNNIDILNENTLIDINDVGAVIFDEVHYINDPDRGKVWEECLVLLPKNINLVMLSATIDRPEQFASWIGNIKEVPISLIPTSHRVVPLKHYFWKYYIYDNNGKDEIKWELIEIMDDKGKFKNYDLIKKIYKIFDINKIMDKLVDYLVDNNYTPALFFKFSRKKCETICKTVRRSLLNFEELAEVENIFNFQMRNYKKIYEILPQYQDVYKQLMKGVVYHHSGLIPILKEIIEILYSKGLVKILFATETFAIGVNMPTKTVLFTEIEKFDNNGMRLLRTDEYLQMSGRAGRRGLDKFGSVIILPCMELPSEIIFKNILTGKSPMLVSKFKLSYQFVLKTISSNNFNINDFLSKTLIMNENDKIILGIISEKYLIENKIKELNLIESIDKLTINNNDKNNIINDNIKNNIINYEKIVNKLNDTLFTIKKKDRDKLEKEKKSIESIQNFKDNYEKFKLLDNYKKELKKLDIEIWNCNNSLKEDIQKIINLLESENYINSKRGIVAMSINECQELIFTEMIFRNVLDKLDFPEIIAVLSCFINEKNQNTNEKYISDLNVSDNVIIALKEIDSIANYFIKLEDKFNIYINSDYNLYLDFIEPAYIWASGGTINKVYEYTTIYDGNFVKAIMRINNICENLMDICKTIERYDICTKLEKYNEKLIRDITTINSLYIQ